MSRLKMLVLTLSLSALPLFADPAPAPAPPPKLHVRPGLWQSTVTTNISGQMPISDDVLAQMTPEQRKAIEDRMAASKAQNSVPRTSQMCLTQDKMDNGFQLGPANRANCKRTILTNTAAEMEVHEVCTETNGTTDVTIHYRAINSETMEGTSHVELTRQGKSMISNGTIQGRWLSADCGDVK